MVEIGLSQIPVGSFQGRVSREGLPVGSLQGEVPGRVFKVTSVHKSSDLSLELISVSMELSYHKYCY